MAIKCILCGAPAHPGQTCREARRKPRPPVQPSMKPKPAVRESAASDGARSVVAVRLSEAELAALDGAAKEAGVSRSAYLRSLLAMAVTGT